VNPVYYKVPVNRKLRSQETGQSIIPILYIVYRRAVQYLIVSILNMIRLMIGRIKSESFIYSKMPVKREVTQSRDATVNLGYSLQMHSTKNSVSV
jgi:hypothetical protein